MVTIFATRAATAAAESRWSGTDHAVEVISALSSLIRSSRAIARARHDPLGASGTPLAVLKALSRAQDGHDRPGDLAVATGVAPSVVSRVLAKLEEDGLVTRQRDESDARACHISLTSAGRGHLDAVHREYAEVLSDALADVSDDELDRIPHVLGILEQALMRAAERVATQRHTGATHLPPTAATDHAKPTTTESH
jgi:DNA-binding MarR family transcriptional regulator